MSGATKKPAAKGLSSALAADLERLTEVQRQIGDRLAPFSKLMEALAPFATLREGIDKALGTDQESLVLRKAPSPAQKAAGIEKALSEFYEVDKDRRLSTLSAAIDAAEKALNG